MKTWLITLPLFCAVGVALADGSAMAPPSPKPEAAMAPAKMAPANVAPTRGKWHKPKRLPRGDLRHCLELEDNMAIIRCAETLRKN